MGEDIEVDKTAEILAFDVGDDIVGILDLKTGHYDPYRGKRNTLGAQRLIDCRGVIVSFNGSRYDVPKLAKLLGKASVDELEIRAEHLDMQEVASRHQWPPNPGTNPILGRNLQNTYAHYFPDAPVIDTPPSAGSDYEKSNWKDCWMAAELWKKLMGSAARTPISRS